MKICRQTIISCLIAVLLVSLLSSCSDKTSIDKTTGVSADDAEMNAAIAEARRTLPQFWKVFDKPEHGEKNFCLKVAIKDKGETEHIWMADITRTNDGIFGTVGNDPEFVHNVQFKQRASISQDQISDWLYLRADGKMVGNYTLRVLLKKMPSSEADQYKPTLADP
jgi:uncharacterized protein YegJ (DUF2314 family)